MAPYVPGPARSGPRPSRLGLLLMVGATAAFVTMAAAIKGLREAGMSTPEVMFWRMAPGLPFVWLGLRNRKIPLWPRRPVAVVLRLVLGAGAMGTNFWALRSLGLLQATVLHLAQPVFVAVAAPFALRERLQGAAIVALGLAVAGAAFIIRPDEVFRGVAVAATALPGFVGLISAALSAAAHMTIRFATTPRPAAGEPDEPAIVVLYFAAGVTVASALWVGLQGRIPQLPPTLDPLTGVALIATAAGFGLAGQLMMSHAYARVSAPVIAMVGYAGIPMGLAADVAVWGTKISGFDILGAVTMVAAGAIIVRNQVRV